MKVTEIASKDSFVKLLPHQVNLVEKFFDPTSERIILLRSVVGLGKTTALIAIVRRLRDERPDARVLLLAPRAVLSQLAQLLRDVGVCGILVDRYRFREMLDSATGAELWPRGVVALLSLDFARQPDVRDSLARTRWGLVIVDEAHWFTGVRAAALRQVLESADRVLLATVALPGLQIFDTTFWTEAPAIVEWQREGMVDHNGMPLGAVPRPLLDEIPFALSPGELRLQETAGALCRLFEGSTPQKGWIAKSIVRSLASSPAALERVLQRVLEGYELEVLFKLEALPQDPEIEIPEDNLDILINHNIDETEAEIARRALQEIETVDDSKLRALVGLLDRICGPGTRRVCVFTEYLKTLYYLAAEIESCGMAYQLLHGGMGAKDRERSLSNFLDEGAILVVTRAVVTERLALAEVTDLVLYDIPDNNTAMQQVLGRFEPFGRQAQLEIHVLVPSNITSVHMSSALGLLGDALSFL